ncbi:YihY/virulence factor BrkB family protein [Kitasatospora humi]|uniref:YihY/virulence factor BrkB family protein n=1 Tax=Kitasatospora humi TaxID=2893891 RepID=UPI003556D882
MQSPGEISRTVAERPTRRRGKGGRRAARRSTWRATVWALIKDTTNTCVEYRVTGLAAEAAFFTLLSIPPLLLCLAGTLGYLDDLLGAGTIQKLQQDILSAAGTVLSQSSIREIVQPLLSSVFASGRPDLISIGFLFSLWSGSRALYIFIDTITVMYGLDGKRGIVKTRAMSLGLYMGALVIGSLVLPLLVAGPGLVVNAVPGIAGVVSALYWPVAILLLIVFLTTLYHVAVPANTPWREDIPGALVALGVLVVCSVVLRLYLVHSVEGPTVYGSLAAPIAVLLWIFVVALAVLIGAAMNAAIDRRWPSVETADARAEHERATEQAAAALVREAGARRAAERAELARVLGLADGYEDDEGDADEDEGDDEVPSEYPERWADMLAPTNVRGRLLAGSKRRRVPPPPPDSDRPGAAVPPAAPPHPPHPPQRPQQPQPPQHRVHGAADTAMPGPAAPGAAPAPPMTPGGPAAPRPVAPVAPAPQAQGGTGEPVVERPEQPWGSDGRFPGERGPVDSALPGYPPRPPWDGR